MCATQVKPEDGSHKMHARSGFVAAIAETRQRSCSATCEPVVAPAYIDNIGGALACSVRPSSGPSVSCSLLMCSSTSPLMGPSTSGGKDASWEGISPSPRP